LEALIFGLVATGKLGEIPTIGKVFAELPVFLAEIF